MKISPNFSLVLSPKVNQNREITTVTPSLKENNKDKFVSKNSVSFKAKIKAPVDKVTQMVKSSLYWKVVGATVAATAAAIWKMLTDAGVKEEDITNEQIQKLIEMFVPKDMNIPALEEDAVVIDIPATRKNNKKKAKKEDAVVNNAPVENKNEKKKAGRPKKVKTIDLAGGKQKDTKKAVSKYEMLLPKVKELLDQKMNQVDVARNLGISELTVCRIVDKYKLNTAKKERKAELAKITKEDVLKAYEECRGLEKNQVAKSLGLDIKELDKVCKRLGVEPYLKESIDIILTKEILEQDFAEGLDTNQIAKKHNYSVQQIREAMSVHGLKNPNRKEREKLSEEKINLIKADIKEGLSKKEIMAKYDLSSITYDRIKSGKNSTKRFDVAELAKEGKTTQEIAEILGKKPHEVLRLASLYDIEVKSFNSEYEERVKKVKEMRDKGMTLKQIAEELGVSRSYVSKIINEKGLAKKDTIKGTNFKTIKLEEGRQATVKITAEEHQEKVQKIKQMLDDGMTRTQIAEKFGVSVPAISIFVGKYLPEYKGKSISNKVKTEADSADKVEGNKAEETKAQEGNLKEESVILDNTELSDSSKIDKIADDKEKAVGEAEATTLYKPTKGQRISFGYYYEKGDSVNDIATAFNVSPKDVRKALIKQGYSVLIPQEDKIKKGVVTDELKPIVLQRLRKGETVSEIAKDLNLWYSSVEAAGGQYFYEQKVKRAIEFAGQGYNSREIAEKIYWEKDRVEYALTSAGVEFNREASVPNEIQYSRMPIKIDDNVRNEVAKVRKLCERKFEIFTEISGKKDNILSYTHDEIFEHYVAGIYNSYKKNGDEKIKEFIFKTKTPRVWLNSESATFEKNLYPYKDSVIPKDDPLYEEFRNCIDKETTKFFIGALINRFYKEFYNGVAKTKLFEALKKANPSLIVDNKVKLKVVLNSESGKELYGFRHIPKTSNLNSWDDKSLLHLRRKIAEFAKSKHLKEYIALVHMFNFKCVRNGDLDLAKEWLTVLETIDDLSNISDIDLECIRELIEKTRKGISLEEFGNEVLEEKTIEEKYAAKDFEFLSGVLNDYGFQFIDSDNDELLARVLDFEDTSQKDQDEAVLRKFIIMLEKNIKGEIAPDEINAICEKENIKPAASGMEKWFNDKKISEIKTNIIELADSLRGKQVDKDNTIAAFTQELLSEGLLSRLDLNQLMDLYNDLTKLDKLNEYETIEAESLARTLADKYLSEEIAQRINISDKERYLAKKDAEYEAFLSKELEIADEKLNFVRDKYLASLGTKMEISLEEAKKCLAKVDSYNSLSDKDKTYITKILSIFDEKTGSELEKDVLKMIVEKEYMNVDTIIKHEVIDELIIPKKNKKLMYKSARKSCDLFRLNEESGKVFAQRHTNGLELMPNDSDYKAHIRILTEGYGATRLSSKKGVQKVKDKDGNEKTIIYLDTFRDKH